MLCAGMGGFRWSELRSHSVIPTPTSRNDRNTGLRARAVGQVADLRDRRSNTLRRNLMNAQYSTPPSSLATLYVYTEPLGSLPFKTLTEYTI